MTVRLATRRSPLALIQANFIQLQLAQLGVDVEVVAMETSGDQHSQQPLAELAGQGVFAVEIQRAVLEGRADVAVHSAKDLPSTTPEGLVLRAVPQRLDAHDVLVGSTMADLASGATVATGSPRRRALLLERRPDLKVVELRGNMATRMAKVGHDGVVAVVAAAAALVRLELYDIVSESLATSWFVPQVGQGALALEIRRDDEEMGVLVDHLNDDLSLAAITAERAFLRELGAGCSVPAGAYATADSDGVSISGVMLAPDGSRSVRETGRGSDPTNVGQRLASVMRDELGGAALDGWRPPR